MKKKFLLPLILILLIAAAFLLRKKQSTFKHSDTIPAFTNQQLVDKIKVFDSRDTTVLIIQNNNWITKEGESVNQQQVNFLFKILGSVEVQSAISKKTVTTIGSKFEDECTHINLYYSDKLIYSLVFVSENDKIIAQNKKKNLFFINMPAIGNELISEHVKTHEKFWYDKLLIHLRPDEIISIQINYPGNEGAGFQLLNKSNRPTVSNKAGNIDNASIEAITDYLQFFEGIRYEFADTSLQTPNVNRYLFSMLIKTNIDKVIHVGGFEMLNKTDMQPDYQEFLGIINNNVMVKLKYSDFDPILVEHDYFQKSD